MKHDIDDGDNYVEAVVCRMEVPVSARVPMETMANCEESARAIRESWAKLLLLIIMTMVTERQ